MGLGRKTRLSSISHSHRYSQRHLQLLPPPQRTAIQPVQRNHGKVPLPFSNHSRVASSSIAPTLNLLTLLVSKSPPLVIRSASCLQQQQYYSVHLKLVFVRMRMKTMHPESVEKLLPMLHALPLFHPLFQGARMKFSSRLATTA